MYHKGGCIKIECLLVNVPQTVDGWGAKGCSKLGGPFQEITFKMCCSQFFGGHDVPRASVFQDIQF